MKLPISWLKDWITLDASAEAVAHALTRRGFYVEGIETHGCRLPGVVVGRVLEVARHPQADRLSLTRVDDGGGAPLAIVCGAPNVRPGMLVPVARIGAELPGGLRIEARRVRGEVSHGMLCSARELGLSDDHAGILDLAAHLGPGEDLVPGRAVDALLGPPDEVLEVEIPFNRPDGLGVVGLAREVRAALGGRWTPDAERRLAHRWQGRADFDLDIEDREGCPRYLAQVLERVTVGPSPAWARRRLEAMGQRSISNVVDATNLVLFEFGQPIHAFDLDRLAGPAIRVRRARDGESITTLDGRERALSDEVLLICDRDRPVAVAGVMGGANSEVGEGTTRLLLEAAWFEPRRIRRSSRFLGLATEAAKRFERGVDPEVTPIAAARFVELLRAMCPDATPGAARERNHLDGRRRTVTLRTARFRRVAGYDVSADEARRALEAMEFVVTGGDPLQVGVPSWRPDVAIEDDLVEEVARALDYDRIPEAPPETHGAHAVRTPLERTVARARAAMRARGLAEAWCTTLVAEAEARSTAALLGDAAPALVRLSNAMSREAEVLRPNLAPGLLRAVAHNLRQGSPAVRLFEVGAGFAARPGELPAETPQIAAVVTGPRFAHAHDADQRPVDFADAKGLWEAFLEEMGVDDAEWRTYSAPGWKPGASAEVAGRASRIGWAGTLSQPLLREWDIEVPAGHEVHLFVALIEPLVRSREGPARVALPGRFPPVRRDLAFFVPANASHREVEQALVGAAGEWLRAIEVFDVYAGPGTPEGMKSLAYALQWQHPERTLAESEVQSIQDRMVAAVAERCGGRLRER
uniref:Phenylalanine--tRNA ligase beta subunit n=1 Tax=Eiseniibacteriota bacterium TaxID=2212470 RepID=A0A832HYP7_UNCEI